MVAILKNSRPVGIRCDFCGKELTLVFKYFNVRYDLIEVDANIKKTGPANVDKRVFELDSCDECVERVKKRFLELNSKKSDWSVGS